MSNWLRFAILAILASVPVLAHPTGALPPDSQRNQQAISGAVTIVGSVVDATLTPIAGVAITLERDGRVVARTSTDDTGGFRFPAIAAGNYRIRAEKAGFPAFSRDLTISTTATAVKLPIVLLRATDKIAGAEPTSQARPIASPTPSAAFTPPPPSAIGAGGRGGRAEVVTVTAASSLMRTDATPQGYSDRFYRYPETGETYSQFAPNRFHSTLERPLSTFGADVDTASYSNIRRLLSSGQLPPSDAVRIEELVNYFHFAYAQPHDGRPIALTTEIGDCPWAPAHKLVLIGARAAAPITREVTGRNIVLLVDVSGSMAPPERLPLIKTALGLFEDTLRPDDSLAIVTYAGTSGVALHPTRAQHRDTIQRAISNLNAGGSTNGAQGLILAYRIAREAYMPGGVNRVILATDGDFNVGITSQHDLLRLIERERESGVFLSVFGVGSGNLKDATMEMLADRGNGHYAYLDSLQEARRVLIREGEATLETVAKDVKFQVEFNPAVVSAWKLLGYENRALAARDFNNDRKDAGEMGAGHTVTVLYEVVPAGVNRPDGNRDVERAEVDPLKYQAQPRVDRTAVRPGPTVAANNGEWLTVKARYKQPESEQSELITHAVRAGGRAQHLPLATAVAEFGLILRDAPRNIQRWDALERRAARLTAPASLAADLDGFRELVATARGLARLR